MKLDDCTSADTKVDRSENVLFKKTKYTLNKMPSIWSWFALKHANKLLMKCLASLINCCSSGGSPSIYLPIHDLLYIFGRFDLIVSSPAFLAAQFLRHRVTLPTGAEMSSSDYVVNYLLCYMRSASNTIRYWGFWRIDRIKKQIFICSSFFLDLETDGMNEAGNSILEFLIRAAISNHEKVAKIVESLINNIINGRLSGLNMKVLWSPLTMWSI